jgi:4,5-dihydroxyphthalate decarboxylase
MGDGFTSQQRSNDVDCITDTSYRFVGRNSKWSKDVGDVAGAERKREPTLSELVKARYSSCDLNRQARERAGETNAKTYVRRRGTTGGNCNERVIAETLISYPSGIETERFPFGDYVGCRAERTRNKRKADRPQRRHVQRNYMICIVASDPTSRIRLRVNRPTLTYAGSTYFDRVPRSTSDDGRSFELQVTTSDDLGSLFRALCREDAVDVAELSLSNYLTLRGNGDDRYVAIPVFPSRSFRHGQIYVNAGSGIVDAAQLAGARVAIPEYHMTAAVWMRAFLEHDFGVSPNEISWHTPADALAYMEEVDFPVPSDVSLTVTRESLDLLLEEGKVDALFTVKAPPSYERDSSAVRRLFPNYREVEEAYYGRTGFFPIMHTIVLRTETYRSNPELALELLECFHDAKDVGFRRLTDLNALAVVHPWLGQDLERVGEFFAGDPFAYGLKKNESTVQALLDYHFEQGLSRDRLTLADVFARDTFEWAQPSDSFVDRRW